MGRGVLCPEKVASEMVSCELDLHIALLWSRLGDSDLVSLDDFRVCVTGAEFEDSRVDLLPGLGSFDENDQPFSACQSAAISGFLCNL